MAYLETFLGIINLYYQTDIFPRAGFLQATTGTVVRQARSQVLRFEGRNGPALSGELDFCFYFMFKTNFF